MRRFLAITLGLMLSAGTAIAGPKALTDAELEDVNAKGLQIVTNDNRSFSPLTDQNNNLDSVQLNDNAQQNSHVAGIVNSAKSAVNASANIISLGTVTDGGDENSGGKSIYQLNNNTASNHENVAIAVPEDEESFTMAFAFNLNKQTQLVENSPESQIDGQNNNNNSVQLNDNAQQSSVAVSIINASTSAVNFGINVAEADAVTDTVSQSNTQKATNMSNYAVGSLAVAGNGEFSNATQTVLNEYHEDSSVSNQNNNNNSVQANDNAQETATVESILNSAQSAANIAGNIAVLGDVTGSTVSQRNQNTASNHQNVAMASDVALAGNLNKQTQNVENDPAPIPEFEGLALIDEQNNNNNSVQANDNAQRAVKGILLENAASSATNAALNTLSAASLSDSYVSQTNIQSASNYENAAFSGGFAMASNLEVSMHPGQYIHNVHASINQDNNNNSVQLNDNAQADIAVDKTINSANSAVNAAQNLLYTGDVSGSTVVQTNMQYAGNHNNLAMGGSGAVAVNLNKQTQVIENCWCTDLSDGHSQNNNMNSVQLNDNAQQNAMGTLIANAADSAVNGALNLLAAATVTSSHIVQSNVNTAINFSNVSVSNGVAVSANAELSGIPMIPILP